MTDQKRQELLSRMNVPGLCLELVPSLKPIGGRGEGSGLCPFHEDSSPSLSVQLETGLFNCHACGEKGDLLSLAGKVWGLDFSGTVRRLEERAGLPSFEQQRVVATFVYQDANGSELYRKERIEPGRNGRRKEFRFKRPDGTFGRGDTSPVLYRLPEVLKARAVVIVEGEQHADLLASWGLAATSLDSGAQSKPSPKMIEHLSGKRIAIFGVG